PGSPLLRPRWTTQAFIVEATLAVAFCPSLLRSPCSTSLAQLFYRPVYALLTIDTLYDLWYIHAISVTRCIIFIVVVWT
ncbi:MAG: hypothetical protein ACRDIV_14870, partial [Ktedonobacteraceae bacterium]